MPHCFVIMPYGKKKDAEGKNIDFDKVYKNVIISSLKHVKGLTYIRSDKIDKSGMIHKRMLEEIYQADVAVVDITALNPNVFYELGVRHSLAEHVTVIIKRKGTNIPFNIHGLNTIDYDLKDKKNLAAAKLKIAKFIESGLETRETDSLVHASLPIRIAEDPTPLKDSKRYKAMLSAPGKHLGIITGDLMDVKDVDIWVSSENINMEMARIHERSISATIRYNGAVLKNGEVIDDKIANELRKLTKGKPRNPGTVIPTSAGELEANNRVKRIFHAAAVVGQPCRGFTPINNVETCIHNALALADSTEKHLNLRSILFPLMGTGQGRGKLQNTAHLLVDTAVSYLEGKPDTVIQEAYFLCWTDLDLEACKWAFKKAGLTLAPG